MEVRRGVTSPAMEGSNTTTDIEDPEQAELRARGRCGARKKQGGGYCKKGAGAATDHPGVGACKLHGGVTPSGRKAAQKTIAKQAVANYGLPIDVDPHTALMDELHRSAGHVAWLQSKVGSLAEKDMTGPVGGAQGGFPEYKPSVWIEMYHKERAQLTRVAKTCIEAGIEERRVRLAEQTGQMIAQVIQGILTDFGVPSTPETGRVVRKHLVGLQSGEA